MKIKRAVIFANGELAVPDALKSMLTADDYFISADGGLLHLDSLRLRPNLVIGDMDSVEPDRLKVLKTAGVEILRYPTGKDETDLELAIQAAIGRGFKSILIVAATGGRLDQTLGNIALLTHIPKEIHARLENGKEEILLCRGSVSIHGRSGDVVSFIPWGKPVKVVHTSGLQYPLRNETLKPDKTRGISNVATGLVAKVRIDSGNLICIHTRNS